MNPSRTASAVDSLLDVNEISARTGHTPKSIRQLRSVGHELYRLARKDGNRLVLEASVVDDWVTHHKADVARRFAAKQRKENRALTESLERLVGNDERKKVVKGYDFIQHHWWCRDSLCRGCLGESW